MSAGQSRPLFLPEPLTPDPDPQLPASYVGCTFPYISEIRSSAVPAVLRLVQMASSAAGALPSKTSR